jgi:hypothetical protein
VGSIIGRRKRKEPSLETVCVLDHSWIKYGVGRHCFRLEGEVSGAFEGVLGPDFINRLAQIRNQRYRSILPAA